MRQAQEIELVFEEKIRSGEYKVGERLPTVRKLAEELGVSKNTTVRAYQALRRKGYLDLVRGSGAFVRRRDLVAVKFDREWEDQLNRVVGDAKRRGLTQEAILDRMRVSVGHAFHPNHLRICFIECNTQDIEAMTRELRAGVGHSMEGILLSDVVEQADEIAGRFDIIVTSFFHLSQVLQALGANRQEKIVGVNSIPDHAALLNLARLNSQVIGVVCEQPSVMDTLAHIIQAYHTSATIITALFDEESRLDTLLQKADVIIVPSGVSKRLAPFHPQVPVITVAFTIEQQSIDFLANRIKELEDRELQKQ